MDGVGEPSLIIEGSSSPHSFVLKPSHAKMIEQADIIFWIGEDIETFMEKPLTSIAKSAKKISFMELKSINKLKFREENIFEHDDHDDHDEHEEDKGYLDNSDSAQEATRFGVSKVADWGYVGLAVSSSESIFGVPYHGEGHEEHGDEDGDEEEGHDEHEGERIFSNTCLLYTSPSPRDS